MAVSDAILSIRIDHIYLEDPLRSVSQYSVGSSWHKRHPHENADVWFGKQCSRVINSGDEYKTAKCCFRHKKTSFSWNLGNNTDYRNEIY